LLQVVVLKCVSDEQLKQAWQTLYAFIEGQETLSVGAAAEEHEDSCVLGDYLMDVFDEMVDNMNTSDDNLLKSIQGDTDMAEIFKSYELC
jgi:hypothetical protein